MYIMTVYIHAMIYWSLKFFNQSPKFLYHNNLHKKIKNNYKKTLHQIQRETSYDEFSIF